MKTFFKTWRRKTGAFLLLAAIGVFCLWMRSHVKFDELAIPGRDSEVYLKSEAGQLCWSRLANSWSIPSIRFSSKDASEWRSLEFWPDDEHRWSWPAEGGFAFGAADYTVLVSSRTTDINKHRCTFWVIPHWSVVLVLSLLAGWLIFRKPKKKPVVADPSSSSPN